MFQTKKNPLLGWAKVWPIELHLSAIELTGNVMEPVCVCRPACDGFIGICIAWQIKWTSAAWRQLEGSAESTLQMTN